ncbi:hypothetical protein R3W88_026098 [Solanum pinnatisectum]|uniref:Uncharacterized protein n=1 Tax=Solanum pinnatisectum TaxID=50273 RepID=A0AAV9LEW7_9SOLN|nr:hypothetical protein R3W88_026098 [Solanum pinnatisectum]
MHARHRSPVGGYKTSSMGMGGVATASRVSPDGSGRGRGLHNSEYRNYNRGGYGRGQSRQFGFQQPSHGNDIFMEAGRLAAEYLVSKGLLPPNAVSGKLPNGSLKSPVGNFQGFKQQDIDEGQTSTLSRMESDVGPGRRRFSDEYEPVGSRNYMRGRRRNESFRSYSSEFNRELHRTGSLDRARAYPDVNGQDEAFPRDRDEQQVAKDSNVMLPSSLPGKQNPDIESAEVSMCCDPKPALGDSGKETGPINTGNDLPSDGEPESKKSADIGMLEEKADPVNLANSTDGLEKIGVNEDIEVKLFSQEHNQTTMTDNDLLSLCRFEKVPTRTRSSLANRGLKVCHDSEDEDAHESDIPKETEVHSQDIPVDASPDVILSDQNRDAKSLDSDKLKPQSTKEEPCLTYANKQSFPGSALMREEEKIEGLTEIETCSSIAMGRGEKRELDDNDDCKGGGTKRPRELASLTSTFSDVFLYHSNSMEKQQISQEPRRSHSEPLIVPSEEKRLVDISMISEGDARLGSDFMEKQLLPSSFKAFDLNLMEASDVNENHDADPVHMFPLITEGVKQEAPVDIHLTMSSNSDITSNYAKSSFDGRDVEVIDLENDSEQEEKAFNNPERKSEVVFTGTDGFSGNAHSTNNIPHAQDGYGLMISELLGNDIASCPPLPADMDSLHNDMGLHNGEGMLGDDDSIYMSLGEIPISFLSPWEQPAQEFGKPF